MTIDAIIFCMQIDGSCEWTFHLGEKLRELLYENDMCMEKVNAKIERENIQDQSLQNMSGLYL